MTTDFAREYHSLDRVDWIRQRPCLICGFSPCQNAHVGTGGMGRKAGYARIVPLCAKHHRDLHAIGTTSFDRRWGVNLTDAAERTNQAWEGR